MKQLILIPLIIYFYFSQASIFDVRAETLIIPINSDTYVDSSVVDRSHALDPDLIVGLVTNPCTGQYIWNTKPVYCQNYKTQIFMHIDTTMIVERGIRAQDITSASIHLFKHNQIQNDASRIDVFTSPSVWELPLITWENRPPMGSAITRGLFSSDFGWQSISIGTWLQEVLRESIPNYGVVIRTYDSNAYASMYYSSRCFTSNSLIRCNAGELPYLSVEYTPQVSLPELPEVLPPTDTSPIADTPDNSVEQDQQPSTNDSTASEIEPANTDDTQLPPDIQTETPPQQTQIDEINTISDIPEPEADTDDSFENQTETSEGQQDENKDTTVPIQSNQEDIGSSQEVEIAMNNSENAEVPNSQNREDVENPLNSTVIPDSHITGSTTIFDSLPELGNANSIQSDPSTKSKCYVSYFRNTHTWKVGKCAISAPTIESIENKGPSGNLLHKIQLKGTVSLRLTAAITYYDCKKRTLWNPKTWFTCVPEKRNTEEKTIPATNTITVSPASNGSRIVSSTQSITSSGNYTILIYTDKSLSGRRLSVETTQHIALIVDNTWIDIFATSPKSDTRIVPDDPPSNELKGSAEFDFPFNHIIGVTQWHGHTAFQNPHTGIDFGATSQPIYSPSDGSIVATGYDTYYGNCLSGGYYLVIKHSSGKHSAYFHLKDNKKPNGSSWYIGEQVAKGQQISTTGHSGAWNCQPLSSHLHYEIRQQRQQSTHTNPVPLTNIDWNAIPTSGWQQYPGRLTGDNPHPTY